MKLGKLPTPEKRIANTAENPAKGYITTIPRFLDLITLSRKNPEYLKKRQ
ncbi:hypothetical protein GACE_2011 [Geoglobus acetivorans]|uniref:Uncharacterized protein n=1 Tax=Geoglobus acetivorans TaxID=565033 RepID=A0A0A7GG23_GEOAI|nr:hypothetical protein GACE_2011 [Geoglobus acetivorans]